MSRTVEEITWCFFSLSLFIILFVCCSEIGTALQHSYFGPGSGLFHYARLGCRGDEKSLLECRSRKFVTSDCNHGNEAGVLCAPPEGQCAFCGSEANDLLSDKCCKHSCIQMPSRNLTAAIKQKKVFKQDTKIIRVTQSLILKNQFPPPCVRGKCSLHTTKKIAPILINKAVCKCLECQHPFFSCCAVLHLFACLQCRLAN